MAVAGLENSNQPRQQTYLKELEWAQAQIGKDIRNNSAWHYRQVVVRDMKIGLEEDFEFLKKKAVDRPRNEAVWNYLEGLESIHFGKEKGLFGNLLNLGIWGFMIRDLLLLVFKF